jgi:hypothetical protein
LAGRDGFNDSESKTEVNTPDIESLEVAAAAALLERRPAHRAYFARWLEARSDR